MSDNNPAPRDTGVPGLTFIVGGLVVAVIIAYFLFSGGYLGSDKAPPAQNEVNVEINNPPSQSAPATVPSEEPTQPPSSEPSTPSEPPPSSDPPPE